MANTCSWEAAALGCLLPICQVTAQAADGEPWQPIEVPHKLAAMAPEITATPHGTVLTWLEATKEGRRPTYALQVAPYREGRFAEPTTASSQQACGVRGCSRRRVPPGYEAVPGPASDCSHE